MKFRPHLRPWVLLLLVLLGCADGVAQTPKPHPPAPQNPGKLVHVVVALCDNRFQGIVPVPERIGNGDDPANNLYWGAGFGVKTFFRKAADWALVLEAKNPKPGVLERCVFKHKKEPVYLIADAYRGREIRKATSDFLRFASGRDVEAIEVLSDAKKAKLSGGGGADLLAYVGHNGLMDFSLPETPKNVTDRRRDAVILACASKPYFDKTLRQTGAAPLLWTTGLMAPEAYTLKAAVDGWMRGEDGEKVRRLAAEAYHRYQKCGMSGAMRLFASGW